jgi:cysteinyl-tRNA synthetase
MYTCGPTVYGPGHLGHARSYTNFDLLKRTLIYQGYKVNHVLNITDVHDDMIKKANEEGITIFELADRYIPLFKRDLADLNILPADVYPRVTEHIPEIIKMIKTLIEKGYAYVEKDGVYFDVSQFKDYGRLSGRKLDQAKTGTRVETDKYEKDEAVDFVLWKLASIEHSWDSPWGMGRPGWHIECSVMAGKYLGKTIDIHAGAMDLKFPHHENEITQSEAANSVKFVNYWVHAGLLEVEGRKMSKSLGNIYTLDDLKQKGFEPLSLRYLFLTSHYRDKMNFTWKSLSAAQAALNNLRELVVNLRQVGESESMVSEVKLAKVDKFRKAFVEAINNDLGIPQALAIVWEMLKSNIPAPDKLDLLFDFDQILGLRLSEVSPIIYYPSSTIQKLLDEREKLRKEGKWQEADKLRQQVEKIGYSIEDTEEGPKIKKIV